MQASASKLQMVENAHVNSKHELGTCLWYHWKEGVHERSTERHPTSSFNNLYDHFRNMLGKPSDINDENEEIYPIYEDLDSETGQFSHEEFQEAKSSLFER